MTLQWGGPPCPPSTAATYRGVAILRPGAFTDSEGHPVRLTSADLAHIAERYEGQYHTAPVNVDHAEQGPAQGTVMALMWDGEYLRADLAGVPPELADALDAGRYPFRSAELYADLDGAGPYLRALALLGARPPSVKGLPPLPQRETSNHMAPGAAMSGLPGADSPARRLMLHRSPGVKPRVITIRTEVRMPDTEKLQSAQAGDTVRLAEENARLAQENRRLRHGEMRREVAFFLSELRDTGRLTPAMERAGVEEALMAADEEQLLVSFPDGRTAPLSAVLREVLRALPLSFARGELAQAQDVGPMLTPEERRIASLLGLSEEEYASIKQEQ